MAAIQFEMALRVPLYAEHPALGSALIRFDKPNVGLGESGRRKER
jgi:hypothetical protein